MATTACGDSAPSSGTGGGAGSAQAGGSGKGGSGGGSGAGQGGAGGHAGGPSGGGSAGSAGSGGVGMGGRGGSSGGHHEAGAGGTDPAGAGGEPSSSGAGGQGPARCATLKGGALIDFKIATETLRVWVTEPAFIAEAQRLLAANEARIPVFTGLLDGQGCDPHTTWHPDPTKVDFADITIELCDGRPSDLEGDKSYWLGTVKEYCPWDAKVVAVDVRK